MIYNLKDWLNEESNHPYVEDSKREALLEYLNEQSDWLYEEGANMNFTVYNKLEKNLTSQYERFKGLKTKHAERASTEKVVRGEIADYRKQVEDLEVTKPWITEEQKKNVTDKINKIEKELES